MLLWLSDTLGTAAHTVKLLTVGLFLRSTGFRNVGWVGSRQFKKSWVWLVWVYLLWVGLGQQIWTHVHL